MERAQTYTGLQTVLLNHDFNKSTIAHDWAISQVSRWDGEAATTANAQSTVAPSVVAKTTAGALSQLAHAQVATTTIPPLERLYSMAYKWYRLTSVWRDFVLFPRASEKKLAVTFTTGGKSIKMFTLSCGSKSSTSGNDSEKNSFTIVCSGHQEKSGSHLHWSLMSRTHRSNWLGVCWMVIDPPGWWTIAFQSW